ncbi:archaetidylserine decarboxylase [Helicobacter enhydrae]|uniref:archaetidylserine decarboxylase n=1 Tax=Helicobacter enhydrae TaxID=222136 RepID=UPI002D21E3F2|nr:archaetidylserine decarboxylase [Helicobacter enhydrae]
MCERVFGRGDRSRIFLSESYLSPRDYHRFHAPCDMEIVEVRYLWRGTSACQSPSLRKNHNLFIRNERVVVVARDKNGKLLYYVAVGALNVGQIVLHFEPRLQTNAKANENLHFVYETPIALKKGVEMGMFKMGSTIVLFAQGIDSQVQTHQKIRFGDRIAIF